MSLLVDVHGDPIPTAEERAALDAEVLVEEMACTRCGGRDGARVFSGFGGWWRLVCDCGNELRRGRGVPPL